MPEMLSRARVESNELTLVVTEEDNAAGS